MGNVESSSDRVGPVIRRSVRRLQAPGKVRYQVHTNRGQISSRPAPHAVASAPRWEVATDDAELIAAAASLALVVDQVVHQASKLVPGRVWRIRARRFDNGALRVQVEIASPGRHRAAAEGFAPFEQLLRDAVTKALANQAQDPDGPVHVDGRP